MTAGLLAGVIAGGSPLAAVAVAMTPKRARAVASAIALVLTGLAGVALGVLLVHKDLAPIRIGALIPLAGVTVGGDALSGGCVAITGAVAIAVGVYTPGSDRRLGVPAAALATLPPFVGSMLLVPLAGSVSTFVTLWELMALASLVLIAAEHRHEASRQAAVVYAVMTQLGLLTILLALTLFAAGAGAATFAGLQHGAVHLSPALRSAVFLLSFAGFGSKAGLVPLHAWLARAHPEAPTPASALLSAAMVNLGIYGMLRVDVNLLGPGPRWWGLTLVIVGAVTAVYAALHAMTASDLKRMLAFSTSENMGLVTLGIGAAMMLHAAHRPVSQIAMAAAVLMVVAHAAFKTLAFLCAGAVVASTGLRDLDRLGGLASRMPKTALLFGIAALGASGLPLGAGFAGEWLLLQGLIHTVPTQDVLVALTMPLAVAAVALTAGLSTAAMVKAAGVGFLARPRSEGAAEAGEASPTMLSGALLPALACVALSVVPSLISPALSKILAAIPVTASAPSPKLGTVLRLPGFTGSVSPLWIAAAVAVAIAAAAAVSRLRAQARPVTRTSALWGCGGPPLTARTQYTASAYAEPLQRVFDDVLRPDIDVQVSHPSESRYLIEKVTYRARIADGIEQRVYRPVTRAVESVAGLVRRVHSGSVHAYLAYGAAGLLLMLVLSR